ncbi:hypothetical protein ACHAWF_001015 [Thalassiosira exigua]
MRRPTAFLPPEVTLPLTPPVLASSPLPVPLPEQISSLPISSSSHLISAAAAASDAGSTRVFEAVAPDPSLFVGMGSVVLLCVAAGIVWANDVAPVSRTKLAISKSRGEVRDYLDGLKVSDNTPLDDVDATTMYSDDERVIVQERSDDDSIKPNVGDGRDLERWLFSDWLNRPSAKGGRQKEPALPILKEAKWNSGDNPVLVTAAIMMIGIVLASITERIAT